MHTRANAWNNGGDFSNLDLLWYARGVDAMQARALNDSASWWFFAAIHGQYVSRKTFPGWRALSGTPQVPVAPVPSTSVANKFWDQCQHQSWFFLPWHRGYLLALEAHVRAEVVTLGGPSTWALPYWNYFGPGNESNIPPAFTQPTLPDGTPNPLSITARYGPDGDGTIFIPTASAIEQHPGDPNLGYGPVTDQCLSNDLYTGNSGNTPPPGFGGPATGFWHGGDTSGNIENNPHNLVHVYVGGTAPDGLTYGLMSDPGIAALDPIFYLHHANVDRMWAMWNANPANTNPTDPKWLDGPTATGDRTFVMPMPDGSSWVYAPKDVVDPGSLDYMYDSLPQPGPAVSIGVERLKRLGTPVASAAGVPGVGAGGRYVELVGANQGTLMITGSGARTSVKLDHAVRNRLSASLASASVATPPDRVYLNLENVRGTHDASVLSVYVNLPEGSKPSDHPELMAGSVGLFGLSSASSDDGSHGGRGLNFVLEITKIVDALHLNDALNVDSLSVTIVPHRPVPNAAEITVGRISIYRQGQ